jgi:hypothetical protein
MAGVTGQRNTVNVAADQLGRDISEEIQMLEPNAQALAIWTSRLNKKRCVSKKVEWGEDSRKARFLSVAAGGALVGAPVIPVTAGQGTYVQQWDQLLNTRTGEQIRVDSIAGDNVTVTRGIGSTAAAMNAADELYLIGAAQPEGDTSKPARSDNPSVLYNLTQIFRTPVEASGTLLATAPLLRPHDWDHQKRKAGVEHAIDKELAFLFGRRSALTSGASEDRTMGGALSFIATNQTDAGGDLSEPEWNAFPDAGVRLRLAEQAVPRVGRGAVGAEQVPGEQAADPQRRDDVRHVRASLHVAVRGAQRRASTSC